MTGLTSTFLVAQAALAALAATFALLPPASGAFLIVPLSSTAAKALPARLLGSQVRLLRQGRWPGSLIVEGEQEAVVRRLGGLPAAVLASAGSGCVTRS